ncbi:MAG: hypothetical protein PHN45_05465 [Methylococcales bacterium]|nr:hypothetical protein [Methylococcales bacterium]MDD5754184.1 hypothetical protein [Methylococcales bacterium]
MLSDEQSMHQAADTAQFYMTTARRRIDELFGEGYAEKNPQLIGDFMKSAAIDLATFSGLRKISESIDGLAESIDLQRTKS